LSAVLREDAPANSLGGSNTTYIGHPHPTCKNEKKNVQEARHQPGVEKVAPGETLSSNNIGGNCWPRELTHGKEP
jgi:hypothetical protein